MSLGDRVVIRDHGDRGEYVLDERGPRGSLLPCSKQCTDSQFGDGDRRDGDVIVVGYHPVEGLAGPVGVDEERRVKQ